MRVMGVDPGLTRCGLALVEAGRGRSVTALDVDVVRTPTDMDLELRLLTVYTAACRWLDVHQPDVVAIERVFAQNQVSTAMGTAQAGGVIALAAAQRDVPVRFHTPSEVKAAVTGSGRADKAQVTMMVTKILGMQTAPRPADAADALALAICHCWRGPMAERMAEAARRAEAQRRRHAEKVAAARAAADKGRRPRGAADSSTTDAGTTGSGTGVAVTGDRS
ncbi:crossover junction endodeoxyribonuclease RuvC [Gordonia jinhuaensis]|uniref:Crossover junction endodeoxyribonuclease RuvC n=1 Tax=Gordonia jinhuaensis TaxID=1517702 RepID=A0A916X071_9ACTN|nr:crossover junction endodeoxyribonuclease RuvC [Gordonia jinhuaensis]GGB43467.1 crossover junction endodeoxyribonuclease RuvC [Gordonia jinhuaensis]